MHRLRVNQHGFSALEVALFVIVMGLVGGTGAYVYQANQNTPSPKTETTTTATPETAGNDSADSTARNWYKYVSPQNAYTIRLADGLVASSAEASSPYYTLTIQDLTTSPGTLARVVPDEGTDIVYAFTVGYYRQGNEFETFGDLQQEFSTNGGLKVQKYYYLEQTGSDAIGMRKGDAEYQYVIRKGTKAVEATYTVQANQVSSLDIVEQMVKTITIK